MDTPGPRRSEVVAVYAAGLFQGLSLVAVPAAATILTSADGYDLSASQYGLLFLPQVILAIAGSLALPSLAGHIGLKRVLIVGLAADTVAMTLLVVSNSVRTDAVAFPMLLVVTGCLGLGFGLTLGSISTYAGAFQPQRREVALTALNVLLGLGTALSPLLIAVFLDIGEWWYPPAAHRDRPGCRAGRDARPAARRRTASRGRPQRGRRSRVASGSSPPPSSPTARPRRCSGTGAPPCSSTTASPPPRRPMRSPPSGRRSPPGGSSSPSCRSASARPASTSCCPGPSPWPCSSLPRRTARGAGIAVFAFAGLACSGFFPMTIGYGESSFPGMVELAAGWLIAAYQIGYGLAAFGGGALQEAVSLPTLFRITAILAVFMGLLSLPITGTLRRPATISGWRR